MPAKVKTVTVSSVIKAKIAYRGLSVAYVQRKTGIKKSTWYEHMRDESWTLPELRSLHKLLDFDASDIAVIIGKFS